MALMLELVPLIPIIEAMCKFCYSISHRHLSKSGRRSPGHCMHTETHGLRLNVVWTPDGTFMDDEFFVDDQDLLRGLPLEPYLRASPFPFRMTRTRATATVPKREPDIALRCTREQDPVTPDDGTVHAARTEQRRHGDHAATKTSTFKNSNHTHRQQQSTHHPPPHGHLCFPIPAQQQ
ncbi:hypothetical protein Pelo_11717 [Pelomyxa schiedti]|nr:hypothetical protein Pelo_11717 [Pelomyxa schiedti]